MVEGPQSVFSQASRLKKYIASFGVFYGAFTFGICISFLNPTILDFSHKFDSPVDHVSKVFSVSLATYLVGALAGGIILKFLNRQLFVMIMLTLMTLSLFTIPYANTEIEFFTLAGVMGLGNGGFDAAQLAWIIDIWRHEAAPFILTQHFAVSVGRLVPPLLLGPFLSEEKEEGEAEFIISTTSEPYQSRLHVPFAIGAAFILVCLISQAALYLFVFRPTKSNTNNVATQETQEDKEKGDESTNELSQSGGESLKRKILLIVLICCVLGFYQGMELCTAQFIPTFSHFSEVGLSEKQSARIALGLQLGFALGRLLGIFLVLKIAPHFLFAGNFLLLLASNIILLICGGSSVEWLWVGSIAIGLGMSTVLPAVYAYIEKYIFVSDSIASIVAGFGGLVAFVYPIIVGNAVEYNPEVMTYVNFLSIAVCGVASVALFYITHVRGSNKESI
ncbi:unnamed protein product [Allacma fusca]|uniref:Sodium-dependent glucose transporter 1 n=1 Tax=Allacma fusca TaxID=39272 RepID=A0A8J2JBR6_9HEXA|nr:unnamed protein product [Allacma fusca]